MKKLYSVKELAELHYVSKSLIYDKFYKKEISVKRVGRRILILASYVEELLA